MRLHEDASVRRGRWFEGGIGDEPNSDLSKEVHGFRGKFSLELSATVSDYRSGTSTM